MKCIQLHYPLLPQNSELKHHLHCNHSKLPRLSGNGLPKRTLPQSHRILPSPSPVSTAKALPHPIVFAAASPAKSGDVSALLQISALLLSMYIFANFVVPELMSKNLGFDKEDKKADDANANKR